MRESERERKREEKDRKREQIEEGQENERTKFLRILTTNSID
jgi:hypothetical protein